MFLLISLFLVAQGATPTSSSRWDSPDVLIEDSLGPFVAFAADYNYTTGDIYVACLVDSGYYFGDYCGVLILRSQDHGLSWQKLNSALVLSNWDMENIDLVVTRDDTLYISINDSKKDGTQENIEYYKFYEGGSQFLNLEITHTAKFLSPVLVRDDFNPFYLYRAYIIDYGSPDSIRVERSTDNGVSWDSLYYAYAVQYYDCDLTVSDSTVYFTYSFDQTQKKIRTRVYRDRGEATSGYLADIHQTSDTINADIEYPRIGATTTLPDNGQLVYTLFSQRNSGTGNWDLLYKYSEDGGTTWSSNIDTIIQGSTGGVRSDIRGYEVAPNQYMDITYCVTSSAGILFTYENYFRWSSEADPTNWHDTTEVSGGLFSTTPEIVYSPGAPASGAAVVFNDFFGNLYFDAPWYSGIVENSKDNEDKTRSEVVLPGSVVKLNSRGAVVYDVTGREITKLTGDSWDLKDAQGEKVKCGIYFIVSEKTGEKVKVVIPIK
jgi:hypothetical protein